MAVSRPGPACYLHLQVSLKISKNYIKNTIYFVHFSSLKIIFLYQRCTLHPVYRRSGRGWEARRVCAVEGDVSAPAASQYSQAASQYSQAASRYSQAASRQFARGGRRVRCFNCGDVTRHMAADCPRPRMPKRCHYCKVMLYTSSEVAIPNLSYFFTRQFPW
jgi:hypothetical protein